MGTIASTLVVLLDQRFAFWRRWIGLVVQRLGPSVVSYVFCDAVLLFGALASLAVVLRRYEVSRRPSACLPPERCERIVRRRWPSWLLDLLGETAALVRSFTGPCDLGRPRRSTVVLVFLLLSLFGVIPGCMVAWCYHQAEYLKSVRGLRDRRHVPFSAYLTFALAHVLGFCVGSCPSSSFSSCWRRRLRSCSSSRSSISCDGTEADSMWAIMFPSCSGTVFDVSCFSQVVCSFWTR